MLNSRDLKELRTDVHENVKTLLEMCEAQGLHVLVTQTKRDDEYQNYLYQQGRTRPGPIITNSPTTTFHGKGLAIDFCKNKKGQEYSDDSFFLNVAVIAKAIGFSWGGDWKSFVDKPHLQWDNKGKYTTPMLRAGITAPLMPRYKRKEEETMDINQFISQLTPEQAYKIYTKATDHMAKLPLPVNWNAAEQLAEAKRKGITDGSRPMAPVTRLEAAVMVNRVKSTENA